MNCNRPSGPSASGELRRQVLPRSRAHARMDRTGLVTNDISNYTIGAYARFGVIGDVTIYLTILSMHMRELTGRDRW